MGAHCASHVLYTHAMSSSTGSIFKYTSFTTYNVTTVSKYIIYTRHIYSNFYLQIQHQAWDVLNVLLTAKYLSYKHLSSYLEKSMQLLLGGLDEVNQDLQKLNMHQRALYKQQTQILHYMQKRVGYFHIKIIR